MMTTKPMTQTQKDEMMIKLLEMGYSQLDAEDIIQSFEEFENGAPRMPFDQVLKELYTIRKEYA